MPRQHLEDNSLVTYQSSNDELPRSVQYAIGLCFTHTKKSLLYLPGYTCILLQEMQEEARKKKPKEIVVSSSSRLAG